MKQFLIPLAFILLASLFLLACTDDALFDPTDDPSVSCYAFLLDSLPDSTITISDTSTFRTIDTIHTADSIVFAGIVNPPDGKLKTTIWNFGDNQISTEKIVKHKYIKAGVYSAVFTITDHADLSMSDTVVVHVNTSPDVDSLIYPPNNVKNINPKELNGIKFEWIMSDPDDNDIVTAELQLGTDPTFLSTVAEDIGGQTTYYKNDTMKKLERYYWRIIVTDTYDKKDTSNLNTFLTTDPDAFGGILRGYALYKGWVNHQGIKIILTHPEEKPKMTITDANGYYEFLNIEPNPDYTIKAIDSLKKQAFLSDSTTDTVVACILTVADTLILNDPLNPEISEHSPTITQTIRKPEISVSFSDSASGILASSATLIFNDSNVTGGATITQTGLTWNPYRLADGTHAVKVSVSDSAGNISDTMAWHFYVDAMKLIAMNDTNEMIVSINDTINMKSEVKNVYHNVVEYKWNFEGGSLWDTTIVSSDTTILCPHVYTHDSVYNAVVFSVDDYGMEKYDTVKVTVKNENTSIEKFSVSKDIISIFDSVTFTLEAVENDGYIVKVEFDFDDDNIFDDTIVVGLDSIALSIGWIYPDSGTYNAVVRVTDDDGKETEREIGVVVLQDVPVIYFASDDTIVAYNGSVKCSVSVLQQFGTITVEVDTANNGKWVLVTDNEVSAVKNIAVGTASSWDSVKVKVTDDDGNMAYTAFKVDIRPRTLSITSIDCTVNTLTVNYGQTQESDFVEYKIYRNNTNDVDSLDDLWATISNSTTTSNSIAPSFNWIPRYYKIYQIDSEGLWSAGSNIVYGNIVNSPPMTPSIVYPNNNDTMWSDDTLKWNSSLDQNDHMVKYKVLINYNNTGYTVYANELTDTSVKLTGYDSLSMTWKVIAYDSEGDSSAWSDDLLTHLKTVVTDIDGNVYHYITIGSQTWMVENLKTSRYNDGTPIPLVEVMADWGGLTTPGYCWYNNDSAQYANKYGALYNWYAVDTKKLAPEGWHVPDTTDLNKLEIYLIANGYNWDGTTTGNKIAKSLAAKTDWSSSTNLGAIGNDLTKNNKSGFSALPGGYRDDNGNFLYQSYNGGWWSATEGNASSSCHRNLNYNGGSFGSSSYLKGYGFSVRLVKD